MTEDEAQLWLIEQAAVSRETLAQLESLVELIRREVESQNLVASSTWNSIWARHVVDSAQLGPLLSDGAVLDIGSGAGFPGLVLAILGRGPVTLSEPRRRRAAFLTSAVAALDLANAAVAQCRAERLSTPPFSSIVARAVAPLDSLFAMADHVADRRTIWVLPKGRGVQSELAAAREAWHGDFRMVNSVTDPEAAIVVATGVARKGGQGR